MVPCAQCAQPFQRTGRALYCTSACRQAAYRDRQPKPTPTPPTPRPTIIYECPACDQRLIHTRRCPDCNLYCRRIGTGGPCPHCDQPVTHTDLNP